MNGQNDNFHKKHKPSTKPDLQRMVTLFGPMIHTDSDKKNTAKQVYSGDPKVVHHKHISNIAHVLI